MANYYEAYDDGRNDGVKKGFKSGAAEGYTKGHAEGVQSGYAAGHTEGAQSGYTKGHTEGALSGYTAGVASGQRLPVPGYATIHLNGHDGGISAPFVLWDTTDDDGTIYANNDDSAAVSALNHVGRVEMPNLTKVEGGMFRYIGGSIQDSITFNLPKVTSVESSGFFNAGGEGTSSIDVSLPACTLIDSAAFENTIGGSISLPGMETITDDAGHMVLPISDTAFGHSPSGTGDPVYTHWNLTIPGVPLAAVENSTHRSGAIEGHVFGLAVDSMITCSDGIYTVGQ